VFFEAPRATSPQPSPKIDKERGSERPRSRL
jgi:hypothetical protein